MSRYQLEKATREVREILESNNIIAVLSIQDSISLKLLAQKDNDVTSWNLHSMISKLFTYCGVSADSVVEVVTLMASNRAVSMADIDYDINNINSTDEIFDLNGSNWILITEKLAKEILNNTTDFMILNGDSVRQANELIDKGTELENGRKKYGIFAIESGISYSVLAFYLLIIGRATFTIIQILADINLNIVNILTMITGSLILVYMLLTYLICKRYNKKQNVYINQIGTFLKSIPNYHLSIAFSDYFVDVHEYIKLIKKLSDTKQ